MQVSSWQAPKGVVPTLTESLKPNYTTAAADHQRTQIDLSSGQIKFPAARGPSDNCTLLTYCCIIRVLRSLITNGDHRLLVSNR